VCEASSTLKVLIRRLRGNRAVSPQGVARLKILLTDGGGPLYKPEKESDLATAAQAALACLDVGFRRSPAVRNLVTNPRQ
jgi:hypothetical protein